MGDRARNQLPNLHLLLNNAAEGKLNKKVLWAYKNKLLGFTSHRGKREKKMKRDIKQGKRDPNSQDPFELFLGTQDIRYVYYKETENILGNTYGMLILQDFEAITPNILARTIETVEGGGLVVLLLKSMTSLKQLYTMSMDVYSRYRTEAHSDVVARFNERFLLSLRTLDKNSLIIDDEMNVLPALGERHIKRLPPLDPSEANPRAAELASVKESLEDVQPASSLVGLTRTVDQAKAVMTFIDSIAEKTLRNTVALTAGRGRGKSAAMGLAIAAAIAHGYSNIFITSPSPENLKTLFEFVFKGLDALNFKEHEDYDILQSTNPAFNNAIVRVNIHQESSGQNVHRQTIQYIQPSDAHVLGQAELVVIDEAAAIPLPLVKKLLGPYLVFMASTINGYEGTGRSLSLKLIQQLREQSAGKAGSESIGRRKLREISLDEPIRYAPGDAVEKWLNKLLCLDATVSPSKVSKHGFPHPSECSLYYINRDALFSFHEVSEAFLHKVMALYVASHYKNSPNDLQLLSDAPAHQLYVLVGPTSNDRLPEPLCVIQVALEGQISRQSILSSLGSGKRAGGDLIPWVVSQQFQDEDFAGLSGARVVRIATSPEYMGMGYGSRALDLLKDYFQGKFTNLSENFVNKDFEITRVTDQELENANLASDELKPREVSKLPPLLLTLAERPPETLDYLGVSYGLTNQLHKFWKRSGFAPVYLRQTANELTGEHTCVMLSVLGEQDGSWLSAFSEDFHRRFLSLLAYEFRSFTAAQGLSIIEASKAVFKDRIKTTGLTKAQLSSIFSPFDLKRLDSYANNRLDYHVIVDMLPQIASLYFFGKFPAEFNLSSVQSAILLGIGLQKKDMDTMAAELNLPVSQTLAMFAKVSRKVSNYFREIETKAIDESMPEMQDEAVDEMDGKRVRVLKEVSREATGVVDNDDDDDEQEEELDEKTQAVKEKQKEFINSLDLDKYAIPQDADWEDASVKKAAAGGGRVSMKRADKKRKETTAEEIYEEEMSALRKRAKKKK